MAIAPTNALTLMQVGSVPTAPVPFARVAALPVHVVSVGTFPAAPTAGIPVVVITDGSVPVAPVETQTVFSIPYDATKAAAIMPIPVVLV
jgi:hypothetical protein